MAVELADLLFDPPVGGADGLAGHDRHRGPEAHVDVGASGVEGIQGPRPRCGLMIRPRYGLVLRPRCGLVIGPIGGGCGLCGFAEPQRHNHSGSIGISSRNQLRNCSQRSIGTSMSCTTRSRGGRPFRASSRSPMSYFWSSPMSFVEAAAQVPLRPESADLRVLGPEGARAPEPVGVPAPEVVADGQPVGLGVVDRFVLDGPVVDGHVGVVADRARLVVCAPSVR